MKSTTLQQKIIDVVVVGAGPAGIAAAIQLKRSGWLPTVFEKKKVGGLLHNAQRIENYPGVPNGIDGKALVELFEKHLDTHGVDVNNTEVVEIDLTDEVFQVRTTDGTQRARSVIVATGTTPCLFEKIRGRLEEFSRYVFYEVADVKCAPHDSIAIIGGGDAAFDYGLQMADRGCRVAILVRDERPHCLNKLWVRASRHPRIQIVFKTTVDAIEIRSGRPSLVVEGTVDWYTNPDIVIVAIGRKPNLGFLSNSLASAHTADVVSRIPGLFFAGDVIRKRYRQVGIAVGDGLRAAMACGEFLERQKS